MTELELDMPQSGSTAFFIDLTEDIGSWGFRFNISASGIDASEVAPNDELIDKAIADGYASLE